MKIKKIKVKIFPATLFLAFLITTFFYFSTPTNAQEAAANGQQTQGGGFNCFVFSGNKAVSPSVQVANGTLKGFNVDTAEKCLEEQNKAKAECAKTQPKNENLCSRGSRFYGDKKYSVQEFSSKMVTGEVRKEQEQAYAQGHKEMQDNMSRDNIFVQGIQWLLRMILAGMGILLSFAGALFAWIADAKNVSAVLTNQGIYQMWVFVRDMLNMAFILVLVFSAFATIFQVQKYNYKNILLTLVIMALLVNFSYPITMFIIDASNVAMYSLAKNFFDPDTSKWLVGIANESGIGGILRAGEKSTDIAFLMLAIIFLFILAITFLAIGVLIVIRTIALAILVVFSPLAFVGTIIPGASGKANQWWDQLFKYALFGPIMMLMLVIASRFMAEIGSLNFSVEAGKNSQYPSIIAEMSRFVIPIVILWMGIGIAQSMSIAGAGAIMGQAQKFMKGTAKFLGKKVDRGLAGAGKSKYGAVRALQYFSPTALKTAWKQHQEEQDRKAFVPATGAWRDKLNKYWTLDYKKFGRKQSRFTEASVQANIAQKQKELESVTTNSEYMHDEYKKAKRANDTEKMAAVLRIMFNNNDQNEFMKLNGQVVDPDGIRDYIYNDLTRSGMTEEQAAKQLNDLGEIAFSKGNFANFAMGFFNPKTGKYEKSSSEEQVKNAVGKTTNMKAQTLTDLWHWNSFLQQNPDSSTGDLHNMGRAQLESLTMLHINQMSRLRPDFINNLYKKLDQIRAHSDEVRRTNPTQAGIIDKFAERIEKMKEDPNFKP